MDTEYYSKVEDGPTSNTGWQHDNNTIEKQNLTQAQQ
jgi:hypothetical protein